MVIKNIGLKKYALIMILGGAIGNLYDRVFFRAVPDFIDFHIGEFHWFVFNIADIFITIGVIFMILLELIDNNKNKDYEKI
jgi:signal peptidase II